MARATLASLIAGGLMLVGSLAPAQDEVPPVLPDEASQLAEGERTVDPAGYDSFSDWLADRTPIPGITTGGFLASKILERRLHARNGEAVGQVVDLAFDAEAKARLLVVRLDTDEHRAVPIASLLVADDDTLFTELTPAQVGELARIQGISG